MTAHETYEDMLEAVRRIHNKPPFRQNQRDDVSHQVMKMVEQVGAISSGALHERPREELADHMARLMITLMDTSISVDLDLHEAFCRQMRIYTRRAERAALPRISISMIGGTHEQEEGFVQRVARAVNGRIRVSNAQYAMSEAEEF